MRADRKTVMVYKFKNTCYRCFSIVEIPLLSDFSYGDLLFQTRDGQDFYYANLIDNLTFDLILNILGTNKDLQKNKIDAQQVLALLMDNPSGKEVFAGYLICPNCKRKQRHFNDNVRASLIEIPLATWHDFESLTEDDKIIEIWRIAENRL